MLHQNYMQKDYNDEVKINRNKKIEEIPYSNYYEFICEMTNKNLYGKYILENYTKEEIEELEKEIKTRKRFYIYIQWNRFINKKISYSRL